MNNPSYLIKSRHSIYYFRYPLPIESKQRVSISLNTRQPKEALRLAKILEYYSVCIIERVDLKQMNHAEIVSMFKQYYAEVLERAKANIDDNGSLPKENISNISNELLRIDDLIVNDCDDIMELYGLDEKPEELSVYKELKPIMDKFELDYEIGSKEYNMMKEQYKFALRNHYRDLLKYNSQVRDYTLLEERKSDKVSNRYTLGDILERYLKEISKDIPENSRRGFDDKKGCLNYLIDSLGAEYPINKIGVEESWDIKEKLQETPDGRNKKKLTKGKELSEQIAIAKKEGIKPLSKTTVNKYLSYFSSFFNWAKRHHFVEENLFSGVQIPNSKKDNRRDRFNNDEISLILEELKTNSHGKVKNKSQLWGSLIAIYTGARRNEVASLMVSDVKQDENGIWYFDITDEIEEGKKTKTNASKRLVPIHSKLIKLGFLDYLNEAKEFIKRKPKTNDMSTRLLYDLTYTKNDQWGRKLGQFVNDRLLKCLNVHVKNKKTLHSFRHSFITYLDIAKIEGSTIKSMVGHEQGTVTASNYTHYGLEHLPQFKEAIEKLPY